MRVGLGLVVSISLAGCGAAPESPPRAPERAPPASAQPAPTSPSPEPDAITKASDDPSAIPSPSAELVEGDAPPAPAKMPAITIASPTKGQLIPSAKIAATEVKLAVRGGDGTARWCVSLDAGPCVRVDDPSRPIPLATLAPKLAEGQHVLAAIGIDATGIAIRPVGKAAAFAAVSFFVEKRTKPSWKEGDPLVVALPPADGPTKNGVLVVDYYVANAELNDGKHLVQVAVAGPGLSRAETSATGRPFHVNNARAGAYLVRIALARYSPELGESGSKTTVKYTSKTLTGPFVDVTRKFAVID